MTWWVALLFSKDVYKTIVFELAKYRNSLSETPVIPERVITRPPSAELRPDQKTKTLTSV